LVDAADKVCKMADEKEAPAKPKTDMKKIMVMLFLAINVSTVGGGAYLVYAATLGFKSPKVTEDELNKEMLEFRKTLEEPSIYYTMDAFNTNLDGLPRRFIRVEVSVEMYDKEGFEELVTLGGHARDSIMRILNGKRFDQIETVQGKLQLKNDIISYLNDALKRGVVKNVYFTKFQVQ
jgi:flagellar protein FliL